MRVYLAWKVTLEHTDGCIFLDSMGPPGGVAYHGGEDTRKKPNLCIFIGHHHHFNSLKHRDKNFSGVDSVCFLFITGAIHGS